MNYYGSFFQEQKFFITNFQEQNKTKTKFLRLTIYLDNLIN